MNLNQLEKNHQLIHKTFPNLDCITMRSKHHTGKKKSIVFLHGAGANMYDLLGLTTEISCLAKYDIFSFQAPIQIYPNCCFWFNLEQWMMELLGSYNTDRSFDNNHQIPELYTSINKLKSAILVLTDQYNHIDILGFSQGGMITVSLLFQLIFKQQDTEHSKILSKLSKIMLLSTTLADYDLFTQINDPDNKPPDKLKNKVDFPSILQVHGKNDQVINCGWGIKLKNLISDYFENYRFELFNQGHEISTEVCKTIDKFLSLQ